MFLIKSAIFCGVASFIGLWLFIYCLKGEYKRELGTKLILTLAWCILGSFFSPNIAVNLLLNFLLVPVIARRPSDIAAVYIFAILTLPGVSYSLNVGGTYLFVWYNFMSVTTGAIIFALARSQPRSRGSLASLASILIIFAILLAVNARGTSPTNVIRVAIDLLCNFILPFTVMRFAISNMGDARRFLVGLAGAVAGLSSLAVYEAMHSWPIYRIVADHYGITLSSGVSVKLRGGLLRAPGPFPEPTSFAFWLALGTLVAISSAWMFKSKNLHRLASALLVVGLFAPQSRGAYLGLIMGYVVLQLYRGKFRAIAAGLGAVSVAGLFVFVGAKVNQRIASFVGLNTSGTVAHDYRQDLFTRGVEEIKGFPAFGRPLKDVIVSLWDLRQGEGIVDFVNSYLYIALTTGLIGLFFFVLTLVLPLKSMVTLRGKAHPMAMPLLATGIAVLAAIYLMLFFTSLGGRTTLALSLFIGYTSSICSVAGKGNARVAMAARSRPAAGPDDTPVLPA